MTEPTPSPAQSPRGLAGIWNRVLVLIGFREDPSGGAGRARMLAALLAVCFAFSGIVRDVWLVSFVMQPPFNLDWALRTVALGWYRPARTLPVTVVEIDEAIYQAWNSPAITPRGDLARLIDVVIDVQPAAVIVDIDLSGVEGEARDEDDRELRAFLEQYRGAAPLIFPKRIAADEVGARRMAVSPYDPLFARQPHLRWAHATFRTDDDGIVRYWMPWLSICAGEAPRWLPSVAVEAGSTLFDRAKARATLVKPATPADCYAQDGGVERRLLVGPRLTGPGKRPLSRDARAVSAAQLLDPEIARDDAGLFGGRIVLIGATHSGSGDVWMTPGGVVPGVELLANAVHYAPLATGEGRGGEIGFRALALVFFVGYVALGLWLSGLMAFMVGLLYTLLVVAVAIRGFDFFRVFESLESAIVLTVLFLGMQALFGFFESFGQQWREDTVGGSRWRRFFRTLGRVSRADD